MCSNPFQKSLFTRLHDALAHTERSEAEQEKIGHYYRQQEGTVGQIAIEKIRQAEQWEILTRYCNGLAALDQRVAPVSDLGLVGMVAVGLGVG